MRTVIVSLLSSRIVLPLALACALGATSGVAAGQLDSLLTNSPFGSAKSASQPADTANQPFEFRGVLEENGQQVFSIFDTTTKRSRWVSLNAASEDFVIKSYDAEAHSISLEQRGRALTLTLKSGPRVVQNTPPPMPSGMQPGSNGLPGQTMPNGAVGKGPEAQRLQQIAEEIRRRRALRQQAPPMPMPTPNGAPSTGGPVYTPGTGSGPVPVPSPSTGSGPMLLPGQSTGPGPMPNTGSMSTTPPKS